MSLAIRQNHWNAVEALSELKGKVEIPGEDREKFKEEIWNDLCSEYDSIQLYEHAIANNRGFSQDFLSFLEAWRSDEQNHAEGFLRLYQECFGSSEAETRDRLMRRRGEFSGLQWFFEDEFRLCLLIAYDELATTVSYFLDRSFYKKIGGQQLQDWIAKVQADEALHLANLLSLIRTKYPDRIQLARDVLEKVLEIDLDQNQYSGTFVLDHTGAPFTPEMLKDCVDRIVKKLEAA